MRRGLRTGVIALGVIVCLAVRAGVASEPGAAPAARCFRLIALFDEIVATRLDHRLLEIEAWGLAEARERRHQAEAYCRTGRTWFGVHAIEAALERIGVPPALGEANPG